MKVYIKSSLNTDLYNISTSSINGGSKSKLSESLNLLLDKIPVNRYILVVGNGGYNTGYLKTSENSFIWTYNDETKELDSYWDTNDNYIVLPVNFKPSGRINYEDDLVQVYALSSGDNRIYRGIEDYDPMKDEDWKFCDDLGVYYLVDYMEHVVYVKWKVGD